MAQVCIFGANRGIGLALATVYSQANDVIAFCRKSSEALDGLKRTQVVTGIDVNDHTSRLKAVSMMHAVDLLILNSGILLPQKDGLAQQEEDIIHQVQTNAISPFMIAKMAGDYMASHSKIALISSRVGSIADNDSGGMDGYRISKTALNAAGKNLALHYKNNDISVFLIHPGYVQTDMTGFQGNVTPDVAAGKIHKLLDMLEHDRSGEFWHADGYQLPW